MWHVSKVVQKFGTQKEIRKSDSFGTEKKWKNVTKKIHHH
jgi:hypothetical protein